jgi:hypothetical protein
MASRPQNASLFQPKNDHHTAKLLFSADFALKRLGHLRDCSRNVTKLALSKKRIACQKNSEVV